MPTRKSDKLLASLAVIKYATMLNLNQLTIVSAKTAVGSLRETARVLKILRRKGLIKEIPAKYNKRQYAYELFWQLTEEGARQVDQERKYVSYKSPSHIEHEHAKCDIITAFVKHYEADYFIEVNYNFNMGGYTPDALITMTHKGTGQKYCFILEYETGTRSVEAIIKEKFAKMSNVVPQNKGLPENTKFLIVLNYYKINPFWRPIEWTEKVSAESRNALNTNLERLIYAVSKTKDKNSHRYLFIPFLFYPLLNKQVWIDLKGNKKFLINSNK